MFDVARVREVAREHPGMAWALACELAQSQRELLRSVVGSAFGSVRQRVARHLLDLAMAGTLEPAGPDVLVVRASQQELADASGSVREVVARVLRDFRDEGLIEARGSGIALLNPRRLGDEATLEF